ncbi:hypothetical protein LSH36_419g03030 [Paralvinella palmiformis]|uniref:PKD/REJ-like domain-containing protein n=1 Tax=Paralvinella palmiformis TaxID=53620 RepID=A0AAD9MY72_9ANNE|nr:hypothetical protein LSH36_419g03030 [Paralvinella palmiformis]
MFRLNLPGVLDLWIAVNPSSVNKKYNQTRVETKSCNASTLFTFTCLNWKDDRKLQSDVFQPAEIADLKYAFSYFSTTGEERPLAGYTTYLPSGDPNDNYSVRVRGYVTDMFASSSYYDFVVTVNKMASLSISELNTIVNWVV